MRRDNAITLAQWEAKAKRQAAQIAKLRRLVEAYDSNLWTIVSEQLEGRVKKLERAREDTYLKMTEVELKSSIAREVEIKELMELPKTAQVLLGSMADEHAALKESLRKLRKRDPL